MIGAERIVRGHDDADRAIHARKLLDDDGVFEIAHSRAAVLLGENHAEQAHFGQLGNDFRGKLGGFVPLHHVRSDFGLGEFADGAPKLLLLVGEGKFHEYLTGKRIQGSFYLYHRDRKPVAWCNAGQDDTLREQASIGQERYETSISDGGDAGAHANRREARGRPGRGSAAASR